MNQTLKRSSAALAALGAYAIVLFALLVLAPNIDLGPLRAVLVLPFVLVVPGWVLSYALFSTRVVDGIERAMLSIALSLAAGALGGLLLNLLPSGLRPLPWLVFYTLLIGAGLIIAAARGAPVGLPGALPALPPAAARWQLALGGVLLGGSLAIALAGVGMQPVPSFTGLSALPAEGNALTIGVENDEGQAQTYRVDVVTGGEVVHSWPTLVLETGERWEERREVPGTSDVVVRLYRAEDPAQVYRQVVIRRTP